MIRMPSLACLLLTSGLMTLAAVQPVVALAQDLATVAPAAAPSISAPAEPAPIEILGWSVPQELLVRGAGSIIGIIVFNVVLTPLTGVPAGAVSAAPPYGTLVAARIVAASLAATAAIGTMFAYDKWTGQAMDYGYAWSRAGFVAGATTGYAVMTGLGYVPGDGWTAAWVAQRVALVGAGLLGGWSARWYAGQ